MLERGVAVLLQRTVVRRLSAPSHVAVVAVGGATLGGSGKTPLAIACAMELAAAGARVVLVGHGYRADPGRARFVSTADALAEVGDEAILAASALERLGGRVVVAPSRRAAMDLGAKTADVLVLDGVGQLTPARASLALLAVDAVDPWGARRTFRSGAILRAPVSMLLGACDAVVPLGDGTADGPADATAFDAAGSRPNVWPACVESKGARVDGGGLMTWKVLGATSIGLIAALARPERLLRSLASHGVVPRVVVRGRDHGPLGARARRLVAHDDGVDLWLATPKCALHAAQELPGVPVAILDHSVALPSALRNALRAVRPVLPALTQDGHTHSLWLTTKSE